MIPYYARKSRVDEEKLCQVVRPARSMADIGSDLRCGNKAKGVNAAGLRVCGVHSDAARERGRKLGGK